MLTFQAPPREYANVYLEDTDKPLPEKLNPNTRYLFLGTIATGGKSVIQSVRDMHLNRIVAYKSLRPEFINDEIEKTRLLREARVSAMLQHPNTMPVYEVGRDSRGNYYFTMKYVHGYTLREILDYRERYDLTQLMDVVKQVAYALAYVHDHGVAHRDIKPENILVGPYGEVLLLDWGLAKVWRKDTQVSAEPEETEQASVIAGADKSITGMGKLQGTICYMSPEQIRKDPRISFSTDTYSLGAVLYELLSGVTPIDGDAVHEILDKVQNTMPPKPSEVSKFPIPKLLDSLCMQCLEKDPRARPASMTDILRVLDEDWMAELTAVR